MSARRVTETTSRRPRGTLYRYLFREMTFPTAVALGMLMAVVLTNDLLQYTELVINRGLGVGTVAMMAFYQAIPVLGTTLPFALMVGALAAMGRLGADLELLVLEACGVSARRLVAPVMAFAALLTLFGLAVSLLVGPWAGRSLDAALERTSLENPGTQVRAGAVNRFGDWKLEALEVNARGDRMRGVLLWMPDVGETVFAETGALDPDAAGGVRITLQGATVLLDPRRQPRQLLLDEMTALLPGTDRPAMREGRDRLAGLRVRDLIDLARTGAPFERQHASIALHRRVSLPLATLVFGFLVIPLFMSRSHFSRSGGGVLGIATTLAYFGLVQLGDGLIQRETVSVPIGVWLPNALMLALGLALFARLARQSAFGRTSERPAKPTRRSGLRLGLRAMRTRRAEAEGGIRIHRFALPRYVAGRFLQMAALCFGVLLVAYFLVDLLDRLEWLFRYGATAEEIVRFYGARVPLLASRVVPMALLVATALTVSVVAAQGELMGMRTCGIPAPRALLPVLALCALIAPLYFLLTNEVVPRTNALADIIKTTQIKDRKLDGLRSSVWYRVDNLIYEASILDISRGKAKDVVIYEVDREAQPLSRIDARSASHVRAGRWRLDDAVRVEFGEAGLRSVPAGRHAQLGEEVPADKDTMHMSVGQLQREIDSVESNGREATNYRVDLHVKIAMPFACILLPMMALLFAVTGPPFPTSALSVMLSVVAAVFYVLLTGVGSSLGYGGALPPLLAGWSATALITTVVLYLVLRLRGFGQSF